MFRPMPPGRTLVADLLASPMMNDGLQFISIKEFRVLNLQFAHPAPDFSLLKPSKLTRELISGVIARAADRYGARSP